MQVVSKVLQILSFRVIENSLLFEPIPLEIEVQAFWFLFQIEVDAIDCLVRCRFAALTRSDKGTVG